MKQTSNLSSAHYSNL
uniref:Uncharacterized protein n=1 Tax=Rhizophora mucronata TaxID=61149 RepID=A0A2P2IWU0_RHIMU